MDADRSEGDAVSLLRSLLSSFFLSFPLDMLSQHPDAAAKFFNIASFEVLLALLKTSSLGIHGADMFDREKNNTCNFSSLLQRNELRF